MIVRSIVALIAVLLLAIQVSRNAAVSGLSPASPERAASLWPAHPASEVSLAMVQIARAARGHQAMPHSAFAMMDAASVSAPLAPEPYLVRGVQSQLSGDLATAQRAFEAAQWRDPRSLPTAYFLADRFFKANDASRGLRQIAALARLSPGGSEAVAPYLAAYARDPANWPALRDLFNAQPQVADRPLVVLAQDIATVPAVLAVARTDPSARDAHWVAPLLNTLIGAGRYAQAEDIWSRTTGARSPGLLYDPQFSDKRSSPPFNWALTGAGVGAAERAGGGRLHLIFYGQQDGPLASQLLLLPPGDYRLSMQLLGERTHAELLNWSVWCDKAATPIASIALDAAAAHGWRFTVPARCTAQWLRLSAASGDVPQQADVTIASLKLERGAPGA